MRTHFDLTDCWITMVAEDAEALRDQLVSGAPTPIDYGGLDKPAEVLAEDAEIATFPLDIAPAAVRIVGVDEAFERGDR